MKTNKQTVYLIEVVSTHNGKIRGSGSMTPVKTATSKNKAKRAAKKISKAHQSSEAKGVKDYVVVKKATPKKKKAPQVVKARRITNGKKRKKNK